MLVPLYKLPVLFHIVSYVLGSPVLQDSLVGIVNAVNSTNSDVAQTTRQDFRRVSHGTQNENNINREIQSDMEKEETNVTERILNLKLNFTALQIEIDNYLEVKSGRRGKSRQGRKLPQFLASAMKYMDPRQVIKELETSVMSSVSCTACRAGVGLLQHYVQTGRSKHEIMLAAIKLCISLSIETGRVCKGMVSEMADEVMYVISKIALAPREICGFIIGDVCGKVYNPWHDWTMLFPPVSKPPVKPVVPPKPGSPTLKVLHLSDTHFDPYYQEGANAVCSEPLCCRVTDGNPVTRANAAGHWGDYRKCDTPLRTLENMLQHITHTHPDIDYVIWTGDLPPHDVWNQTKEHNLQILRETVEQMTRYFPKIPIFPALGNHESSPVNSFPPPFVQDKNSISWLYDELDQLWRRWLPESTSPTVRSGGFYSLLVKPGFRIISLNMNYCNNKNWWLLMNSTDPAEELHWLIYELQNAEFNEEKVHILGHIPPGHSDCLKVWSHNYYKIVNRYESTIAAQFFGHTHFDEFEVFYDEQMEGRATSIAYIGPSVTPYYKLNPGYRLYTTDGNYHGTTKMVTDHETWVMDLMHANRYKPYWFKLYSAQSAYRMPSLVPQEWDALIHRLTYNDNLFQMYYNFYWKASTARPECDSDCKKRLLCDLKSGKSNDRKKTCQHIEERIDASSQPGWQVWMLSGLAVSYVVNFFTEFSWIRPIFVAVEKFLGWFM